jgi:chitodextrinase
LTAPAAAATTPGRPGSFTVASRDGKVVASWSAAAKNGARVTKYQVASARYIDVDGGRWSAFRTVTLASGARSRSVSFVNGSLVAVKVRAYNSRGWGPWTRTVRITVGLPAPVPGTRAVAGNARVDVTWSAANGNGSPVTNYWVYKRAYVSGTWSSWDYYSVPGSDRSAVARQLTNGRLYQFYVVARSSRGLGPAGAVVSARPVAPPDTTPPDPVTNLAVTDRTSSSIELTWSTPATPDLASVVVRRALGGTPPANPTAGEAVTLTNPKADTVVDAGLSPGTTYSYALFTRDTSGNTTTTPATVTDTTLPPPDTTPPGPVTGLEVGERTPSSIALSWSNPAAADLASVIVRRAVGAVPPPTAVAGTAVPLSTPTATTVTDAGLAPETTYSYSVFTRDSSGNTTSSPVTVSASTTAPPPPPAAGAGSKLALGGGGGCVVTDASGAVCWGSYPGDGTGSSPTVAVTVPSLTTDVVAVTQGPSHKCALTTDGAVLCWGDRGGTGQLGDGVLTGQVSTPMPVLGLQSGVVAISGGYGPTCALTALGAVMCWGGDGSVLPASVTLEGRATPTAIAGISGTVASLGVGERHACVVTTSGSAQCWGDNGAHQVGRPSGSNFRIPGTVTGLGSGVAALSAGALHTCVVTSGGAALCWGRNFSGEAGNPDTGTWPQAPTPVTGLDSGVASIEAGTSHTCAVTTTGASLCWGRNEVGELGTGDRVGSSSPRATLGLGSGTTRAVVAGTANSCALSEAGTVLCWGSHTFASPTPDVPWLWLTL